MTTSAELVAACDRLLSPARFKDYTLNGLQVEGRERATRVMSGVTACQALLDEAVAWEADLLLVHHGYFWKNEPVAVTGMKRRRLATLLGHEIGLLALSPAAGCPCRTRQQRAAGRAARLHGGGLCRRRARRGSDLAGAAFRTAERGGAGPSMSASG